MPRSRGGKASFVDDSNSDDEFLEEHVPANTDPASKYRIVFGGRTHSAILSGKRFQFSTKEKTTMFRTAINQAFSNANLPSPAQLLDLGRELNIPLQADEMTEVCLKKVLSWICSNVTPEKTKGLIVVHDKGYGEKKIKLSKGLVDAVNEPGFSFKWIAQDKKMKGMHNATGGQWLNVNNRNELGATALLDETMSELTSNPPTPSRPAVQALQPPRPAPLVSHSQSTVAQARSTSDRAKLVAFTMDDCDSPSEDSDSDGDIESFASTPGFASTPDAAPYITPQTETSRGTDFSRSGPSFSASPYSPTPAPRTARKRQEFTLSSDTEQTQLPPHIKSEPDTAREQHVALKALRKKEKTATQHCSSITDSLCDQFPLMPIESEKKTHLHRSTPQPTGPSSANASDPVGVEAERLWQSLCRHGLTYTKEQARLMVLASPQMASIAPMANTAQTATIAPIPNTSQMINSASMANAPRMANNAEMAHTARMAHTAQIANAAEKAHTAQSAHTAEMANTAQMTNTAEMSKSTTTAGAELKHSSESDSESEFDELAQIQSQMALLNLALQKLTKGQAEKKHRKSAQALVET